MAKVRINGEYYEFDQADRPLHEAIAIEKTLGIRYAQYQDDLVEGSARALAGFIWLVLRRSGKDVPFADIESGAYQVDRDDFRIESDPEPDPTGLPTEASSSTGGAT